MANKLKDEYVLLYDGYCPTCNWAVNYILDKDKTEKTMKFAALQSDFAELIMKSDTRLRNIDSVIIFGKKSGKIWIKSDAFLVAMKYLGGNYKYFGVFKIIPRFIRDLFYDLYAKNRYRFTGKYDACMIPDKQTLDRTIEFKN
jgi:predicted DCC family thiol-disulfide oxidoreductase YuxK